MLGSQWVLYAFMQKRITDHLKSKLSCIFPTIAVAFWLIALVVVKLRSGTAWQWMGFWIYATALYMVLLNFIAAHELDFRQIHRFLFKKELLWWSLVVLVIAISSRFWLLTTYPFVSVGDEQREVGLYAMQLANGERRDLFGYGAYEAYGMIIPTISSWFYGIFGSAIITYRIQAALLGIIDIFLVYVIALLATKQRKTAIIAGLVLATLPLHLYYSRTEVVVMYASTFTLLLLLLWYKVKQQQTTANIILLATLIGFALGLYAAVRTVALMVLFFLFKELLLSWWRLKQQKNSAVKKMLRQFALVLLFVLIGFGPRLWHTNVNNFFSTKRLPLFAATDEKKSVWEVPKKYVESLLVWYNKPTATWYADHQPIVLPMFTIFLVLGIATAVFKRNWYVIDVLFLVAVLHFTNSAMTDIPNADHRLAPVYGIGAILIAMGVTTITDKAFLGWSKKMIYALVGLICMMQLISFFVNQPANKNKVAADYLSIHVVQQLQATKTAFAEIRITLSNENFSRLNTRHYKEQYQYFFPGSEVVFGEQATLHDHEVIVSTIPSTVTVDSTLIVICEAFTCPKGQDTFVIQHRAQ